MKRSFRRRGIGVSFSSQVATIICAAFLLGFSAISACAQTSSAGTVTGQVVDQQGAQIPGADVKLIDAATSSALTTTTNSDGRYVFPTVPPATYSVVVSKAGFATSRVEGQTVEVGSQLTVNATLQVGATTTTVEVQAAAGAELQTLNATVGATITGESVLLLPNLGRDASVLSVLQVGVAPTGNVAGAATDQNGFQLDGGNNSDDMAGTNTTYTPGNGYIGTGSTGGTPSGVIPTPSESIEEFKVGTSQQTADFNGAAGSQVQMVTKRGTNAFHGALYEYYFANNVGAANLWKNNHTPDPQLGLAYTPLPKTHRNRFGGALGGPLTPKFWGGKTYFFANYEGMRYPNTVSFERAVPTALFKAGVITLPNSANVETAYNINPYPVTIGGVTYPACSGTYCDPRGIGVNKTISQVWSQLPLPNDPQYNNSGHGVDGVNVQGYLGTLALPQSSNFFVARIDHDFGDKWKFMGSYRDYSYLQQTNNQTTLSPTGQYTATAPRPQKPDYFVGGLTGQLTANLTNDVHISYLRNFWQWSDLGGVPQLPGLGGALEMGGEAAVLDALIPTNVNSQNTRQRFWDGHDQFYRDDLSLLKGNQLFQFGASYMRNYDFHSRNDNGVGIDTSTTYQITNLGIPASGYTVPSNLSSSQSTQWDQYYAEILGIVGQSQLMYTRSGNSLTLNPPGSFGFDQDIIPTYDFYFTDTWHMKPTFTLTYGLAYSVAMPPYEINGKQVQMVDAAGNPIALNNFLANRQTAALAGQAYAPEIGFETIRNVGSGEKYPYNPFYKGFSPRVSAAWNPNFDSGILGALFGHGKTVVRGGYARIYGRTNGVDLVLVPLLGPGLLQAVSCNPSMNGTCAANPATLTPANAFRIGTDGNVAPLPAVTQNLAQPYFSGVNGNAQAADGSQLDPNFKPNHSDEFSFTIQRAISSKMIFEVGYIGRKISNEFQQINIDAVPWMTTLNGQSFAQAYANTYAALCGLGPTCTGSASTPVPVQPFFEAALGGPNSSFCSTASSCTAAVAKSQFSSFKSTQVYSLWQNLSSASGWTLGRTLLSSPALGTGINAQTTAFEYVTSNGYGNYNAAFTRFTTRDWHGLTTSSNLTWSRALGTGSVTQSTSSSTVPNPWNLSYGYGPQAFDIKFVYSLLMLYQPPIYKSQHGILGHVLGGWTISPLFTAQSGVPLQISVGTGSNTNAQAFGEVYGNGNSGLYENAIPIAPFTGGNSSHNNVTPCNGVGTSGNSGINMFTNPCGVFNEFRPPILGIDTNTNGAGPIRGFPTWNLDATVSKDIHFTERLGGTLIFQFVNVLNHFQPANPTMSISSPSTWGVVSNQFTAPNGAQSRWMEFGLRLRF